MKHGSVYQRHTDRCPRDAEGNVVAHRCRGSWAYVLEYGRDSNGRRLQTSKSGYPTRAAAQSALQERVKVLATGVASHTLTVGEYLDSWLQGKHALKPSTRSHYRASIELYLKPHLGAIRLLELQPHHLDRFYVDINLGRRGRPLSPASLRRVHACLRSALGTAVKRRLIPYNPALHIELAPENPKRPRPWTAEQCRVFLSGVADDRLEPLYHLLILTGLRRGEAVGLRWVDVDLDRQFLRVVQQVTEVGGRATVGTPKSRRSTRVVPLDDQTVDKLRRHRERQVAERAAWGGGWQDSGLVFTREDGRVLRPEYVTRHFQALAKEHRLPVIRLHDLRHTNATLALEAGVDLKVVSERLGHSTTAITADIYTHVAPTVGQAAAQRIADVLAETSDGTVPEALPSGFLAPEPQTGASRDNDHA